MIHPYANGSSGDYFRTPRRGFIQGGQFVQYPEKNGGPSRGETDEEYSARLALFDAGIQRVAMSNSRQESSNG